MRDRGPVKWKGARAAVTGAASGIGRATAEALAREGALLYLCDKDADALASTAAALGASVRAASTVDVSKRDDVARFADAVHADGGALDVLVNNAGVGLAGGLLETSLEDWEWVISVNLWGVIHGCHYFVPKMAERGRGHVVNVSSGLGLCAAPGIIGYCTTKFGVVGLSESLAAELRPKGVGVSVICPGIIDTNIVNTTRYTTDADATRARVIAFYKKRAFSPDGVADAILDAVERRREVVPVTVEAKVGYWLKRLAPGLMAPVGRMLQDKAMGSRR
jgi:NAD(P)-dependent dehydrogenase (short-subunit alcohol dehydrogenase family)